MCPGCTNLCPASFDALFVWRNKSDRKKIRKESVFLHTTTKQGNKDITKIKELRKRGAGLYLYFRAATHNMSRKHNRDALWQYSDNKMRHRLVLVFSHISDFRNLRREFHAIAVLVRLHFLTSLTIVGRSVILMLVVAAQT